MLTNPGTVPINAQPLKLVLRPAFCARCQCYKPPRSHHDHASGRCISRMDHHCPWTNNVIALRNQKHFLLFLIYADIAAVYIYGLVLWTVVRTALPCNNENVNTASLSNKPHSRFLNQDHGG
ncbi:DHHC palmitoyltransferase-domain-containing protein [Ochromonadaceae sp. CCMP2298]|nr:DHHC palmitoyltransferase-domain-containing protein [Ochromonadaceae sp. CCMP2298]